MEKLTKLVSTLIGRVALVSLLVYWVVSGEADFICTIGILLCIIGMAEVIWFQIKDLRRSIGK